MNKCKVIAVTNQKGGVAKTTTTVNLGAGLAQRGKRVLLVDADPQGSLAVSLGRKNPDEIPITLANVMQDVVNDRQIDPTTGILHTAEMETIQATLNDMTQQISMLQEQAAASAELAKELKNQHQRLLTWSDMFTTAPLQKKKTIASYIIKAVTLSRGYGIQVEFNISEAQYLGDMEMG